MNRKEKYYKGRLAQINQTIRWSEKQLDKATNAKHKTENSYTEAHLAGVLQTHIRLLTKLRVDHYKIVQKLNQLK